MGLRVGFAPRLTREFWVALGRIRTSPKSPSELDDFKVHTGLAPSLHFEYVGQSSCVFNVMKRSNSTSVSEPMTEHMCISCARRGQGVTQANLESIIYVLHYTCVTVCVFGNETVM